MCITTYFLVWKTINFLFLEGGGCSQAQLLLLLLFFSERKCKFKKKTWPFLLVCLLEPVYDNIFSVCETIWAVREECISSYFLLYIAFLSKTKTKKEKENKQKKKTKRKQKDMVWYLFIDYFFKSLGLSTTKYFSFWRQLGQPSTGLFYVVYYSIFKKKKICNSLNLTFFSRTCIRWHIFCLGDNLVKNWLILYCLLLHFQRKNNVIV